MKRVIAGFLLVLWLFLAGNAGAQLDCQEIWEYCFWQPPHELTEVTQMIAMYRGPPGPEHYCDCGPSGDHFPLCVDLNGNCIPLELSDVIYMISAYRGDPGPIMCPDCF